MKTLKISDQTHAQLTKIVGQLTAETGKIATYEDAINELLDKYENLRVVDQNRMHQQKLSREGR
jgi:hypothetical protein